MRFKLLAAGTRGDNTAAPAAADVLENISTGKVSPVAGRQGLEPRYAAPEAAVLPLDDLPTEAKGYLNKSILAQGGSGRNPNRIPCRKGACGRANQHQEQGRAAQGKRVERAHAYQYTLQELRRRERAH